MRIFYRNKNYEWEENLIFTDINFENIPLLFVVKFYNIQTDETTTEKVWCPIHKQYENITKFLSEGIITDKNCYLRGAPVFVTHKYGYMNIRDITESINSVNVRLVIRPDNTFYYEYITVSFRKHLMNNEYIYIPMTIKFNKSSDCSISTSSYEIKKLIFPETKKPIAKEEKINYNEISEEKLLKEKELYNLANRDLGNSHSEWECNINGYNFRQVHFLDLAERLKFHYYGKEDKHKVNFFIIERNKEYFASISILHNYIITQNYVDNSDEILKLKMLILIKLWANHNHLKIDYHGQYQYLSNYSYLLKQKVEIKPIEKSIYDNIPLIDLLKIPLKDIQEKYYLYISWKSFCIRLPGARPNMSRVDELTYLQECQPLHERIFNAAHENNSEALFCIYLKYANYLYFQADSSEFYIKMRYWYIKALQNGWKELELDIKIW